MDFFEVLKNKASGTSEQDKTLSGVPPIIIPDSNGKPLSEWSITGNTYQEWTPSPEPTVGNNKLDNSKIEKSSTVTNFVYTDSSISFGSMTIGSTINSTEIKTEETTYAFSFSGDTNKVSFALKCYNSSHTYLGDANKIFDEENRAVMVLLSNTAYIRLVITATAQGIISLSNLMLNKGNTVMTFEPFKYLPNTGPCEVKGVGEKTGNLWETSAYESITVIDFRNTFNTDTTKIKYKENTQYTFSCNIKGTTAGTGLFKFTFTYTDGITKSSNWVTGNSGDFVFVSDENKTITSLTVTNYNYPDRIVISNIMLNEGSEPLPYEPYGYKVPVVTKGKNLVNQSEFENLSNWAEVQQGTNRYILDIHGLSIGEQYIVSSDKNQGGKGYYIYINRYDENGNSNTIARLYQQTYLDANLRTFTVEKGYKYRFWIWSDNPINLLRDVKNIQLELGDTATEYEPYISPITPLNLNSPLMSQEIANSERVRDIKFDSYIFDGTEDWHLGTEGVSNIFYYGGISNWNRDKKDDAKVTHFVVGTFDETVAHNHYCTFSHAYSVNAFNVHMQECGTVAEFKAFLASEYAKGTPVAVYYPRTDSSTTTIESPEILTVKGSNIIEIETDVQPVNMEITYKSGDKNKAKTFDNDFYRLLFSNN